MKVSESKKVCKCEKEHEWQKVAKMKKYSKRILKIIRMTKSIQKWKKYSVWM